MIRIRKHLTVLNLSGLYIVIWGMFIANPSTNNFDVSPRLFEPMRELVNSEVFWGGFMIAIGLIGFILHLRHKPAASLVVAVFFAFLASLFFIGDFERPGWALIGVLAVFNFLNWRVEQWTSHPSNG